MKATLDKQHGLVGIALPTCQVARNGNLICPTRFVQDYLSGHARMGYWKGLTVDALKQLVEAAILAPVSSINNTHPVMQRNG